MTLEDSQRRYGNLQFLNRVTNDRLILLSKRITKVNKRLDQSESRLIKLEKIPSPPIVVKERNNGK